MLINEIHHLSQKEALKKLRVTEVGRYFVLPNLSPFLKIGVTKAGFILVGENFLLNSLI